MGEMQDWISEVVTGWCFSGIFFWPPKSLKITGVLLVSMLGILLFSKLWGTFFPNLRRVLFRICNSATWLKPKVIDAGRWWNDSCFSGCVAGEWIFSVCEGLLCESWSWKTGNNYLFHTQKLPPFPMVASWCQRCRVARDNKWNGSYGKERSSTCRRGVMTTMTWELPTFSVNIRGGCHDLSIHYITKWVGFRKSTVLSRA